MDFRNLEIACGFGCIHMWTLVRECSCEIACGFGCMHIWTLVHPYVAHLGPEGSLLLCIGTVTLEMACGFGNVV